MFMVKCLIKLKNCTVQQVWCNPKSDSPMPFATICGAHEFAVKNVLNKKYANIANANKVIGIQIARFDPKFNMKLVA